MMNAASPQVYLRLRICVSDVQQDGLLSVLCSEHPEDHSPDDDVYPQVSVCSERLAAVHLMWDSESLQ